jgi:4,5-dihydroxyphthalate decarboxylase
MAKLQLSIGLTPNERTDPILRGGVGAEGVELTPTTSFPSELFYRQLKFAEFDVSEMSLSSLTIATGRGQTEWCALPVFTTRFFFHTNCWVRRDAGIERPQDLRGKRAGVPEYQQTAAVWARGALLHEFGVAPDDLEWHMERTEELSHGGATGFVPPPGLRFHRIPPDRSLADLLLAGEVDAAIHYIASPNLVDRSRVALEDEPTVRRLFPDPTAEGVRYHRATGLYPANHCVVVRRSLVDRHPWLPTNLFEMFEKAKAVAAGRLRSLAEGHVRLGLLGPDSAAALEEDPYPYGCAANRETLETLVRYVHEQGLASRTVALAELFAPTTMGL